MLIEGIHTIHNLVYLSHSSDDLAHALIEFLPLSISASLESRDDTIDEWSRVLDHVNMNKDKSCFRRLWIETMLESTDETQVIVF